jgi:hypothetical protein
MEKSAPENKKIKGNKKGDQNFDRLFCLQKTN